MLGVTIRRSWSSGPARRQLPRIFFTIAIGRDATGPLVKHFWARLLCAHFSCSVHCSVQTHTLSLPSFHGFFHFVNCFPCFQYQCSAKSNSRVLHILCPQLRGDLFTVYVPRSAGRGKMGIQDNVNYGFDSFPTGTVKMPPPWVLGVALLFLCGTLCLWVCPNLTSDSA